jgi:hypothetical protein
MERGSSRRDRPARAHDEIVATNLSDDDLSTLSNQGFVVKASAGRALGRAVYKLGVPLGFDLNAAARAVQAVNAGATAAANDYYYPDDGPDDGVGACTGPQCPAVTMVGWPQAMPERCGSLPLIGMVDTGINGAHEALKGQSIEIVRQANENAKRSGSVHGTAIAALLIGRPDSRTPGLLPGARLIAVDAFYRADGALDRTDVTTLVDAIETLTLRGVKVLNLSLSGPPNPVLEQAIADAAARDIVVVAAAGNNGPGAAPSYPAGYNDVIAVTAIDRTLAVYTHATQGAYVDLAAPGVDVWTATSVSGGRPKSGTSFAAPFVTAAATLLRASHPQMKAAAVSEVLSSVALDLGEAGPDPVYGSGLVQVGSLCSIGPADRPQRPDRRMVSTGLFGAFLPASR